MSSTSSTSATASPSAPPSDNGSGLTSKGADYFFGFLVTFIVLLSLFVCCGFNTRRRLIQRRMMLRWGDWDTSAINIVFDRPPPISPTFFEPGFVKGDRHDWLSMQPLSAQKILASVAPRPSPPPPLVQRPSMNPQALHGLSLPSWTSPSRNTAEGKKSGHHENDEPTDVDHTVMQIAVLIAMPRPAVETNGNECLEIGVASLRFS